MSEIIDLYNDLAAQIWNKMVTLVGMHAVLVLAQRALWLTKQKYDDAGAIKISEDGIFFDELEEMEAQQLKAIMEEFFGSLAGTLTRLIGKDIAKKITREIDFLWKEKGEKKWND